MGGLPGKRGRAFHYDKSALLQWGSARKEKKEYRIGIGVNLCKGQTHPVIY